MRILVTGSSGLIGGEAVEYFGTRGHEIVGIDNNMRQEFFGPAGSTLWNLHRVAHAVPNYKHHESDIRNGPVWETDGRPNGHPESADALTLYVFQGRPFDAVIHCAAQPSHDKARENPKLDRQVNVLGTHNLLESTRRHSPNAVFIFMSTNKVYDDVVNQSVFSEYPTRYDVGYWNGFNEATPTGAENVFGQHKLEADLLVREYARRWGLKTVVLRGGCLTGPGHSGVEAHGFLSYLVRCAILGQRYHVYGYKGKQVRDNIHSFDVCRAFEELINRPHIGSVFNIGGGRGNSCSIIEAIDLIERMLDLKMNWDYVEEPRQGDHKCYITDLTSFKSAFPTWSVTRSLEDILSDIARIAIDESIQTAEGQTLERVMRARDALRTFNLRRGA